MLWRCRMSRDTFRSLPSLPASCFSSPWVPYYYYLGSQRWFPAHVGPTQFLLPPTLAGKSYPVLDWDSLAVRAVSVVGFQIPLFEQTELADESVYDSHSRFFPTAFRNRR
jgi:hypothetical protein